MQDLKITVEACLWVCLCRCSQDEGLGTISWISSIWDGILRMNRWTCLCVCACNACAMSSWLGCALVHGTGIAQKGEEECIAWRWRGSQAGIWKPGSRFGGQSRSHGGQFSGLIRWVTWAGVCFRWSSGLYMCDVLWECTLKIPAEISSFPEWGLGGLD